MDLRQNLHSLQVPTTGKGFFEINQQLADWLKDIKANDGLLTLFIRHTSASLTIQENADPTVALDLMDALDGLAPQRSDYRHDSEGPDDMPSHIKGLITQTQVAIPIVEGQMVLGTWQGIFVIEHRTSAHNRKLALHYSGT